MKVDILLVTCGKDLGWARCGLRSIQKFARGFNRTVVVCPTADLEAFNALRAEFPAGTFDLLPFEEWPGKGMLHHEVQILWADEICPEADYVVHFDSDNIFTAETTPELFFIGGKPTVPYIPWTCHQPAERPVVTAQDAVDFMAGKYSVNWCRYAWKFAAEAALGFATPWSVMCGIPLIFPRVVYPLARMAIETHTRQPFEDYVRGCRNEFPQSFCEFDLLGSVLQKYAPGEAHWWNVNEAGPLPAYRNTMQFWSHGGFDRGIDPEGLGRTMPPGTPAPRMYLQQFGLL